MEKLSVIIPVYNVEKYLKKCIESVIKQTYKNLEIILIDDGSTDQSSIICDKYKKLDNRIRVIHKENGGISSARNMGIRMASADFITFVDSDDWIAVDIYEYAMDLQKKSNADIVQFAFEKVYSEVYDKKTSEIQCEEYNGKELIPCIYQSNSLVSISPWAKIYRKGLFINNMFTENRIFEDTLLMPKLFFEAKKVLISNKTGYYYYQQNMNSVTKTYQSWQMLDRIYAHQDNRKFYKKNNLQEALLWCDTTYSFVLIDVLKKCKKSGAKKDSRYKDVKKMYSLLIGEFLRNPYILQKQKILLILYWIIL